MPLHTETLTSSWYQLEDLDDETYVMVAISGDDCEVGIDAVEPLAGSSTITLAEGLQRLDIPTGKYLWFKTSGTTDITYSQFGALVLNATDCAYAFESNGAVETGFADNVDVRAGSDDLTVQDETLPYQYYGFLKTVAADLPNAGTIASAVIRLQLLRFRPGVTFRLRGCYTDLTSHADIAGLTTTTANVTFTVGFSGVEQVDITAIIQEMVDDAAWDDTYPIRLTVLATAGATDTDDTIVITRGPKETFIIVAV